MKGLICSVAGLLLLPQCGLIEQMEQDKRDLEDDLATMRRDLEQERSSHAQTLEALRQRQVEMQEQVSALNQQKELLQSQVQKHQNTIQRLNDEWLGAQQELEVKEKTLQETHKRLEQVRKDLKLAQDQTQQDAIQIALLKDERSSLAQLIAQQTRDLETWKDQHQELQSQLQGRTEELSAIQAQLHDVEEQHNELENYVRVSRNFTDRLLQPMQGLWTTDVRIGEKSCTLLVDLQDLQLTSAFICGEDTELKASLERGYVVDLVKSHNSDEEVQPFATHRSLDIAYESSVCSAVPYPGTLTELAWSRGTTGFLTAANADTHVFDGMERGDKNYGLESCTSILAWPDRPGLERTVFGCRLMTMPSQQWLKQEQVGCFSLDQDELTWTKPE